MEIINGKKYYTSEEMDIKIKERYIDKINFYRK
jgi:hypothetical protein